VAGQDKTEKAVNPGVGLEVVDGYQAMGSVVSFTDAP
jgi:hypothetical protein